MRLADPFVINDIGKYILQPASVQPDRPSTRYIVIHHAADTYSPSMACASIFRAHCTRPDFGNYHRIGYHEVIQLERDASLAAHLVNPPNMQGAGVAKMNHLCYHICAATNFIGMPEDLWIEALAQRAAAALRTYPGAQIVGHKDIALAGHGTTCPGPLWSVWKLRLTNRVAELLAPPAVRRMRLRGWPIYQAQSLTGTLAGHLQSGETVEIDKTYNNGGGHLKDNRGFIDLNHDAFEEY